MAWEPGLVWAWGEPGVGGGGTEPERGGNRGGWGRAL